MRAHPMNPARPRAGSTLLELLLVVATMSLVFGGAIALMKSTRDAWTVAGTASRVQEAGRKVLAEILNDMRRSGFSIAGGASFPAIYERARGPESTPRGPLVATMNYADEALVSEVYAWQGVGSSRIARNSTRVADEIVFQHPADLDGDGTPLDALGNLEWSPEVISYRIYEEADGVPWLVRYTELNGLLLERRVLGRGVGSITFDVVLNDRSLRFNELAVVLYMEGVDARGSPVNAAVEGSVVLRNTREL